MFFLGLAAIGFLILLLKHTKVTLKLPPRRGIDGSRGGLPYIRRSTSYAARLGRRTAQDRHDDWWDW